MKDFINRHQFKLSYVIGFIICILFYSELIFENPAIFFLSLLVIPFFFASIFYFLIALLYVGLSITIESFEDAINQRSVKKFLITLIGFLLFLLWLLFGGSDESDVPFKIYWRH